jgi:PAS domain-containing protein
MVIKPDIQSPNIPIQGLPIPVAALDGNGVIVVATTQFARLCGLPHSTVAGQRLADLLAESDRPAVEEAFAGLTEIGRPRSCRIQALRARLPCLWLAIDIAPLTPDSGIPYVACLQPILRRRRGDSPPRH